MATPTFGLASRRERFRHAGPRRAIPFPPPETEREPFRAVAGGGRAAGKGDA